MEMEIRCCWSWEGGKQKLLLRLVHPGSGWELESSSSVDTSTSAPDVFRALLQQWQVVFRRNHQGTAGSGRSEFCFPFQMGTSQSVRNTTKYIQTKPPRLNLSLRVVSGFVQCWTPMAS